jgi:hypothetical protein
MEVRLRDGHSKAEQNCGMLLAQVGIQQHADGQQAIVVSIGNTFARKLHKY